MAESVKDIADPCSWVEQHPLASLGTGAAIGFLLASGITPSTDQTVVERIKSLVPRRSPQPMICAVEPAGQKKPGIMSLVMEAVTAALAGSISSAVKGDAAATNGNGQTSEKQATSS